MTSIFSKLVTRPTAALLPLLCLGLLFSSRITGLAESVTLAWDRNPETDVTGYQLYYGTNSGIYSQTVNVGNTTEVVIPDLESRTTYYAVVTAYNTAGLESFLSEELAFKIGPTPPIWPATLIFLEAEAGEVTAPMLNRPDPNASGEAFMETAPTGDSGGAVTWEFPAPAGPVWQIWARLKVPAGSQGAFAIAAGDGPSVTCHPDPGDKPSADQWTWARFLSPSGRPHTVGLTGGTQTLTFRAAAALTGLDRIVLSADPAFIPPSNLPASGDYLALTTQPQNLTVFAGVPAGLTVTSASNGEVHYQWYQDDVPIPEAYQPYLPVGRMSSETASYRLVVTLGDASLSSGTAGLRVLPPPVLGLTRAASPEDGLRLNVEGRQRQALILEYSDDLQQWHSLATFPGDSDGPDTVTDSAAPQTTRQRFYRLSVPAGE